MNSDRPWSVAETLYSHGLTVRPYSGADLAIEDDDDIVIAEVKRLQRAPRASQIEKTRSAHPDRTQLYIVPSITPSTFRLGVQYPFTAFVGVFDGELVWKGEHSSPTTTRVDPGRRGRQPWVRWAVMRALLAPVPPMNQVRLAEAVGAAQGSVSHALQTLDQLVARTNSGWVATAPERLWDRFMETYPGVGVVRTHWVSMAPPVEQARMIAAAILEADPGARVLYSGDMGADMIAGWRVPTRSAVYSDCAINPEPLGFAAAKGAESTLEFVMPHDPTIWRTAKLFSDRPVADPLIIASELELNPAVEIDEAIAHLKQQTLQHLGKAQR